jgi:hypothetical protein
MSSSNNQTKTTAKFNSFKQDSYKVEVDKPTTLEYNIGDTAVSGLSPYEEFQKNLNNTISSIEYQLGNLKERLYLVLIGQEFESVEPLYAQPILPVAESVINQNTKVQIEVLEASVKRIMYLIANLTI